MKMKTPLQPSTFTPGSHAELIGPAAEVARIFHQKSKQLNETGGPARIIIHGPPGVGKSRIADMLAQSLVSHSVFLEKINGRNVSAETIREWQRAAMFRPIPGQFVVKLINEIDTATVVAKDIFNDFLDDMPPWTAIIGTTNRHTNDIAERFETRFQQFGVKAPDTETLAEWLKKKWKLPQAMANAIAVGSGGNIRAALLDTQSYNDTQQ